MVIPRKRLPSHELLAVPAIRALVVPVYFNRLTFVSKYLCHARRYTLTAA